MKLPVVAAVIGLVFLVRPSAEAQTSELVVARAGNHAITFGELAAFADDGLYHYLFPNRLEALERALDDLVVEEIKRIDLFASGLAHDSTLIRDLSRNVTEELVLTYAKHNYEDQYLNEATIRAEHGKMGLVVLYRQIVLGKPASVSPAGLDTLRSTVSEISLQLEAGIPFEAVLKDYDGLDADARLEGALSRVTWEQTVANPRARILFHLSPGAVRSFETPTNFSIARVERIEEIPARPLDEVRDQIVDALHRRHAAQATQAFRSEWIELVDTTALQWHAEGLAQVVEWFNSSGFFEGSYLTTVEQYLARGRDATVFADERGELRLSHLPAMLDDVLTVSSSGGHDSAFVKEFLLEAIRTKRLADRARAAGLFEEIWRADTPSPILAAAFVRYYNQRYIEDRIPEPSEEALREFYREFSDSLFYQLARVNTQIIVRTQEEEIVALWEKLQQGAAFDSLSHRRLIRSFARTRDGEIVTLFNPEPPYLGDVAFGLQEGESVGPISYEDAELGRLFAIVHATQRLEERQLSFDDVREGMVTVFNEHYRNQIAANVKADLRSRYPVTVHHDVLADALARSGSGAPRNGADSRALR